MNPMMSYHYFTDMHSAPKFLKVVHFVFIYYCYYCSDIANKTRSCCQPVSNVRDVVLVLIEKVIFPTSWPVEVCMSSSVSFMSSMDQLYHSGLDPHCASVLAPQSSSRNKPMPSIRPVSVVFTY